MACIYSEDCILKQCVVNWVHRLGVLSKDLLSDIQFIISTNRFDYISSSLVDQEQSVRVIKYLCKSEENCKICEKIEQYKTSVHKAKQELEDIRKSIHTWKVTALKFARNVNYFILCLIAHRYEHNHEEEECEIKMEGEGATGQNEHSREQQQGLDDSEEETDYDDDEIDDDDDEIDDDEEETEEGEEIILRDLVLTTELEIPVYHGKRFSVEALERMYYKIRKLFNDFKQIHYSHICTLVCLLYRLKQEEIKHEIAELVKEVM